MQFRLFSVLTVLLGMGVAGVASAQTPLPNTAPKLTLAWIASLTLNPTTAPAGSQITGTVILLRPAISNLSVGLNLSDGTPVEGNLYVADGAIIQSEVTVPAGSDRANFTISTFKPASTKGSKTFTVNAIYGAERKSASFTTTQLLRPKIP